LKACTKCKVTKPLSEFYANKKAKDGKASRCSTCVKENSHKQREESFAKGGVRCTPAQVMRRYGCSLEEYKQKMQTSNCCEICSSTDNLVYDHCHETMEFRGVLCKACNRALGLFGDTKEGLLKAVRYLESD
jgi:hypothetical protein